MFTIFFQLIHLACTHILKNSHETLLCQTNSLSNVSSNVTDATSVYIISQKELVHGCTMPVNKTFSVMLWSQACCTQENY